MPSPFHPVLLAQLCKSCPSLKRQLVLQVRRKERREHLGRRQQARCTASLLEKPRGLEELTEPPAVGEGMQGTDSSGGKGQPAAWETGRRDGGAWKTRSTHNPWLGVAYPIGFFLCNSHMANTACKQTMRKLATCTESRSTWQCWLKWRHQLQQQRGVRREGTEGVPVSK